MQIQSFITILLSPFLHVFNYISKNTKLEKLSKTNSCIITDIFVPVNRDGELCRFSFLIKTPALP